MDVHVTREPQPPPSKIQLILDFDEFVAIYALYHRHLAGYSPVREGVGLGLNDARYRLSEGEQEVLSDLLGVSGATVQYKGMVI